jgi:hypothetical protein
MSALLWTADEYKSLREKLASPVPSPEVNFNNDCTFLTVDSVGATASGTPTSASDRYIILLQMKNCMRKGWPISFKDGSFAIFCSVLDLSTWLSALRVPPCLRSLRTSSTRLPTARCTMTPRDCTPSSTKFSIPERFNLKLLYKCRRICDKNVELNLSLAPWLSSRAKLGM